MESNEYEEGFDTNPDRLQSNPLCRIGSHVEFKIKKQQHKSLWACALQISLSLQRNKLIV